MADNQRKDDSKYDAQNSTGCGENNGLDQELKCDVPTLRTKCSADADLTSAFGDAREHDVHDSDTADE